MTEKETAAPFAPEQPQGTLPAKIVAEISPLVNNPLKRLRLQTGVLPSKIIETVQVNYPRFNLNLYANCERTQESGIELCEDAFQSVVEAHAPQWDKKGPTTDRHLLPCRVSCRLTEIEYNRLQAIVLAKGFETMQAFLAVTLRDKIRRFYKEAAHALLP